MFVAFVLFSIFRQNRTVPDKMHGVVGVSIDRCLYDQY